MTTPVLSVRDLSVEFVTRRGALKAIDGVSFDIAKGEVLGVVGESGAGKSVTGSAVIGLIDPPGRIARRRGPPVGHAHRQSCARRDAQDPRQAHRHDLPGPADEPQPALPDRRAARRDDPHPHQSLRLPAARKRAVDASCGGRHSRRPSGASTAYPHEFSGGMRQRVVIALALCAEPELIIADEPTTALDVSVQAQIIALLKRLGREHGTAIMLVTHDMGVIAETADRVAVMYAGRIVEIGPVREVVQNPLHPYAKGLMGAIPSLATNADRLVQIPGSMPRLSAIPPGCAFNPRCPHAFDRCRVERPEPIREGPQPRRLPSLRRGSRRRGGCRMTGSRLCRRSKGSAPRLRRLEALAQPRPRRRPEAIPQGGRRRLLRHRRGRDLRARRRIRLRQVDRRAHGRRPPCADLRRGDDRRRLDDRSRGSRWRASACAGASR